MKVMFYEDNHIKIYNKDCRAMNELPDECVQMVCCSPPYWGLRRYSGEQELIWGDNQCKHEWNSYDATLLHENRQGLDGSSIGNTERRQGKHGYEVGQASFCSLCGAWKGAYGLEPTPEMYIEHTILILREIRRVLRKDGVVFWNIGDSYWGGKGQSGQPMSADRQQERYEKGESINQSQHQMEMSTRPQDSKHNILKPKDLCLIPFRLAIAAQEMGWWVRSVIIWSKPNPMPESVTDRPTESHEYILMLTKNKKYYWDADAVREPHTRDWAMDGGTLSPCKSRPEGGTGWATKAGRHDDDRPQPPQVNPAGRNIRSVWEFPTQPYPEAHFAVFPERLPELCIKAATPEVGCCSKCGKPWERITKIVGKQVTEAMKVAGCKEDGTYEGQDLANYREAKAQSPSNTKRRILESMSQVKEYEWQPTCKCNADKVPSIVLDPFMGAGTTLWVAKKLNRKAVGYEISEEYCQLAVDRCRQQALL